MVTFIRSDKAILLDAEVGSERLKQWRLFRAKGYRILDKDGVTVWHEKK